MSLLTNVLQIKVSLFSGARIVRRNSLKIVKTLKQKWQTVTIKVQLLIKLPDITNV